MKTLVVKRSPGRPKASGDEAAEKARQRYLKNKAAAAKAHAEDSAEARDIGELPAVVNPERRARCAESLRLFIEEYIRTPSRFNLPWSPDHLRIIARLEQAVRHGGLFALAMPRGSGKTSISERAALWATLYGYRRYVVLIGDGENAALESLETIKTELATNERLHEDFPEVCYPIQALGGIIQRCRNQTYHRRLTGIYWGAQDIAYPVIPGSQASGSVITAVGILGRIRGMKRATADGRDMRPDLVLVDDPQNDESAASPEQNRKRLRVLNGAVLGLAGPGVSISGVMPCTVIRPGDMADTILDRDKSPDWNGERCKMLLTFPSDMDLWAKYNEIRQDCLRTKHDISEATAFYLANRAKMDRGAKVSWEERYKPDEVSAVQSAMNLFYRDKEGFYAEYQNEPLPEETGEDNITPERVWAKMDGRKPGEIPDWAEHLTAYIDVQGKMLFWSVCAFGDDFTGCVVDCGSWPRQKRRYYSLRDATVTFDTEYPGRGLEGQIYAALQDCTAWIAGQDWRRRDGVAMPLKAVGIDSSWGESTKTVYDFILESEHKNILYACKGRGIGAAQRPMTEYRREPGMKIGYNWILKRQKSVRGLRLFEIDTNFWKSFFRSRLYTSRGDASSFGVFGKDIEATRLLAEHLSAEVAVPTSGNGRKVDIWKLLPGRENHWLDCVVACHALASMDGASLDNVRQRRTRASETRGQRIKAEKKSASAWSQPSSLTEIRMDDVIRF